MAFSTLGFIFHFLPIFLIVYFLVKPSHRNVVMLLGSLVFYAFGNPIYILLLLGSVLINFFISDQIHTLVLREKRTSVSTLARRRGWLVFALIFDIGMLFFFKYAAFTIEIINSLMGLDFQVPSFALPLGISFYTFQMISFVADVYRGEIERRVSFVNFAAYATMFPMITSGPITRYKDVADNLECCDATARKLEKGITIFILGLGYKVLLADKIASLWTEIWRVGAYGIDVATAWLGAWAYSFRIYFDFAGYSMMAIGIGYILGFHIPENFRNPYCVKTMTSFWRNWHITLGAWFKDYVYIPLGGNRVGALRSVLNIFIVWMLTGIWHGASYNFLIWGLFLCAVILIEKGLIGNFLEKSHVLGHLYMICLIPISWTIFNITDLTQLVEYLGRMFGVPLEGMVVNGFSKFTSLIYTYWWLVIICIFFCTPYPLKLVRKFYKSPIMKIILFILFWFSVYQISRSTGNPFIYFQF